MATAAAWEVSVTGFFFNDTATTEIYTLSLHDALPIRNTCPFNVTGHPAISLPCGMEDGDRKSTRLNSSHVRISYAVFCLKKKKHGRRAHRSKDARTHTNAGRDARRRVPRYGPGFCLCVCLPGAYASCFFFF